MSSQQQQKQSAVDISRLVLEYLSKKGFTQTEAMLRLEQSKIMGPSTSNLTPSSAQFDGSMNDMITLYSRAYSMLHSWMDNSLEMYKYELEKFMYPIFVHSYLNLIKLNLEQARTFFEKFKHDHVMNHDDELKRLDAINSSSSIEKNQIARLFMNNKYKINVSQTSLNLILRFLNENQAIGGAVVVRILNDHLDISTQLEVTTKETDDQQPLENIEGIPQVYELIKTGEPGDDEIDDDEDVGNDNDDQSGENSSNKTRGGKMTASQFKAKNETPLKLGMIQEDPEYTKELEAELKFRDEKSKDKSKVTLMEEYEKNFKVDPNDENNPTHDSIPLPPKSAMDIKRKILEIHDSRSKLHINPSQAALPSVCMYTFHNTNDDLTCLEFNDDSTIVAGGFQDSFVKLWSIDGSPLKSVLKNDPLNKSQEDDGLPMANTRRLVGHSGSVYGLSFSPDNHYLLSSSEDSTVRLWSMDTFTGLVSYKGHNSPVWDVEFSPLGHYFLTGSHDQTARLWSCDHIYPLRIFAGHLNDVDVVKFHPNSNYVFTGSSDKTIRMWDINKGESVRLFMGHSTGISSMSCSPDGRWLASGGEDGIINVWDIGSGRRLKSMRGHGKSTVYDLQWSRDGNVIVSGGEDNSVRVWDVKKGTGDANPDSQTERFGEDPLQQQQQQLQQQQQAGQNGQNQSAINAAAMAARANVHGTPDHMAVYFTKRTPVFKVHFTRRNLCLVGGVFRE